MAQRQRAAVACANCRLSKTKCTEYRPCKKCANLNVTCVDDVVNGPDFQDQVSRISSKTNHRNSNLQNLTKKAVQNCRHMIPSSRAATNDLGIPNEAWAICEATAEHNEPILFPHFELVDPIMMEFQATTEAHRIPHRNFESVLNDVILVSDRPSSKNGRPVHAPLVRPSALHLLPAMHLPQLSTSAFLPVALAFPSNWGPFVPFQTMHPSMLCPNPLPLLPEMCILPTSSGSLPPSMAAIPSWGLALCPAAIHNHVPYPFLPLAAPSLRGP